jgi:hypothetical protein
MKIIHMGGDGKKFYFMKVPPSLSAMMSQISQNYIDNALHCFSTHPTIDGSKDSIIWWFNNNSDVNFYVSACSRPFPFCFHLLVAFLLSRSCGHLSFLRYIKIIF